MFAQSPYFFKQKKTKRFRQRRLRKFDNYSIFGDKRETHLTFRGTGGDTESVVGGGRWKRPTTAGSGRPGSAWRRVSISEVHTLLPPIDPTGPKLVTAEEPAAAAPLEAVEVKSIHSEIKQEFLKQVEKKEKVLSSGFEWKFSEAKFASSSILSNISKLLYKISDDFEISLPVSLVERFVKDHQHLIEDTVVEKREWQTDCYIDFQTQNRRPFLTTVPEESERAEIEAAYTVARQAAILKAKEHSTTRKQPEKKVRMSRETIQGEKKKAGSPERPHTARSILSNFSFKSDVTLSSDDGRDSRFEYDPLPAELRPNILLYRRESSVPRLKASGPKTRLEKFQRLKKGAEKTGLRADKKLKNIKHSKHKPDVEGADDHQEDSGESPVAGGKQALTTATINFSLAAPNAYDTGWLVSPSDSKDPEANTLRMWQKQLQELMRKREEAKLMAKQRGEDGPLVVKFYNDPKMRTLRSKHQRSATFPLPTVLHKLPPSMANFSSPTAANEANLIGEGLTVFVLMLPDGSGYLNYHSGREAMCHSRAGDIGSRGHYTLVYDDVEESPLLAYFTPSGKACCYYQNGNIQMLCDKNGGCLYDEDGVVTRKWAWPPHKLNLSQSISIQLNVHISLRCTNLTNMVLRFCCRSQNYKLPVGPSIEDLDEHRVPVNVSQEKLISGAFFISKTALSQVQERPGMEETVTVVKPGKKGIRKRNQSYVSSIASEDEANPSSGLLCETDQLGKLLTHNKEKIQTVINDWMDHYRRTIGIKLPAHSAMSRPSSTRAGGSHSRSVSSQSRMVRSCMSFTGDRFPPRSPTPHHHTRSYTHPFPTRSHSRALSPLLPIASPVPDEDDGVDSGANDIPRARTVSPIRPVSPLDYRRSPPHVQELHPKPFTVGISKPQKRPTRMVQGCPVALHNKIWKDLDIMSPCKCDKRRAPFISDLVYDKFLQSQVPKHQLVVVCVLSSIMENSCPCEPMLDTIHYSQNRMRYSPCTQCSSDTFRLLKYDLSQSRAVHGFSSPLLAERHNAKPGMFLMYMGGRLVYADYMFNGYGTARKDFVKQIQKCVGDGKSGRHLPYDFKFTHKTGTKIPGTNTWAYPVSGVLQDLIPFTPSKTNSSTSSSQSSLQEAGESRWELSAAESSQFTMDYLGMSYADVLKESACSLLESKKEDLSTSAAAVPVGPRES